jgi:hypothetical protein
MSSIYTAKSLTRYENTFAQVLMSASRGKKQCEYRRPGATSRHARRRIPGASGGSL